jgi:hypothetical protein
VPVRITAAPLRHDEPGASALLLFVEDISLVRKLDALSLGEGPAPAIVSKSPQMQEVFELLR